MQDVREGARLLPLAWTLGWLDIRLRYRGSMLGPLWLTLSTGIMVGALGYLYAGIFHTDIHDYLPFLALSLVLVGLPGHRGRRNPAPPSPNPRASSARCACRSSCSPYAC